MYMYIKKELFRSAYAISVKIFMAQNLHVPLVTILTGFQCNKVNNYSKQSCYTGFTLRQCCTDRFERQLAASITVLRQKKNFQLSQCFRMKII